MSYSSIIPFQFAKDLKFNLKKEKKTNLFIVVLGLESRKTGTFCLLSTVDILPRVLLKSN